jgi:hypothetical protein
MLRRFGWIAITMAVGVGLSSTSAFAQAPPTEPEAVSEEPQATPAEAAVAPAAPQLPPPAPPRGWAPPPGSRPPPGWAPPPPGWAPPPAYYWQGQTEAKPPPKRLPYYDGQNIPPGYRLEEGPRRGLVIAGSITFGTLYGLTLLGASESDFDDGTGLLAIPVIGPLLYARHTECPTEDTYCDDDLGDAFLTIDAVGQATGAVLLAIGILNPKKELVRTEDFSFQVAPQARQKGGGFVAFGRF